VRRSELGPERILAACRRIELRGDRRDNAKLGRAPVRFSATKGDVLTIYIQKDSPGKDRESNWLPAPDGPIYIGTNMGGIAGLGGASSPRDAIVIIGFEDEMGWSRPGSGGRREPRASGRHRWHLSELVCS
jgi:hypothetical protein